MKNLIITSMLLFFLGTTAWAQAVVNQQAANNEPAKQTPIRQFTDADKDGVCDNYSTRPADGRGRNFIDSDKNGVCDNQNTSKGKNLRQGRGNGNGCGKVGNGHRHGQGGQGRGNGNCLRNQNPAPQK
jgi:hypothetical protein